MPAEDQRRLAAFDTGEDGVTPDGLAGGRAVAVPVCGGVSHQYAAVRTMGEPSLGLRFLEVDTPLPEGGGRDGAAEPEEGDTHQIDGSGVEDVEVVVARARGLEFLRRLRVAADEDGGAFESGDGVDDWLETLALGGEVAGADEDVAGAGEYGEGFDGSQIAMDVAEGKDFHTASP